LIVNLGINPTFLITDEKCRTLACKIVFMKKITLIAILLFGFNAYSSAQNVGIGTAAPLQKLHVSDAGAPNNATVQVTGLSTATTLAAGTAPFAAVMVDANGVMYRGGTTGAVNANAWYITGNAGTVPATNFIGTTDAQDFVTKSGGSAATNERMRVIGAGASPGQVVVNNTGIFPGDVFSAYANNTTNGTTASINNIAGTFAVNGYAAGNGTGVYGEVNGGATTAGTAVWGNMYGTATTASTTSEGVWGTNGTAPAGTGITAAVASGVRGEANGVAGTAFTMGVLGVNTGTTGSAFGLYGQTSSPASMGVFGVNLDVTAAPAHGIQGQTGAIGSAAGVRGFNIATAIGPAQNGFGVRGTCNVVPTGTGFVQGVRGDVNAITGNTYGVYGQAASATGFGVDGVNTNVSGTGLLVIGNNAAGTYLGAGSGAAINGNGIGTLSIAKTAASGTGEVAVGNNLVGSILTLASGSGIAATGTQYGVVGFATTTVNTNPLNNAATNLAAASAGGYFEVQTAGAFQTYAYVGVRDNGAVNRKIIGPGTVNTIVKDTQGNLVALSCPEAPENLFQDYGHGQLTNGSAHISIDPILSTNIAVNADHPLRVFVQLEGDCKGVYVTNKTATGFDVIELNGGNSNVAFSYTLVANRADEVNPDGTIAHYSAERFPAAPGPQAKVVHSTVEALSTELLKTVDEAPVVLPAQEVLTKKTADKTQPRQ
jgi:hypothetical protein